MVGNPENRFSDNEAHLGSEQKMLISLSVTAGFSHDAAQSVNSTLQRPTVNHANEPRYYKNAVVADCPGQLRLLIDL